MVGDANHGSGEDVVGRDDVGAVDPDVAGFDASGPARGNFDCEDGRAIVILRHTAILPTNSKAASLALLSGLEDAAKESLKTHLQAAVFGFCNRRRILENKTQNRDTIPARNFS
jgi:hypothetical protein